LKSADALEKNHDIFYMDENKNFLAQADKQSGIFAGVVWVFRATPFFLFAAIIIL